MASDGALQSDFAILCIVVVIIIKVRIIVVISLKLQPKHVSEGVVAAICKQLLLVSQVGRLLHILCRQDP